VEISVFPQTCAVPAVFFRKGPFKLGGFAAPFKRTRAEELHGGAVGNFTASLRWRCGGLLGPLGTAQARDVLAGLLGKFMRRHMVLAVCLQKSAPPSHDHPMLLKELGLVDIRGAHIVALLMAHLALDGRLRPQSGPDQFAARHGAKAVAADVHFGVVAHRPQGSVHCVLGQRFPRFGVSSKH